MKSRQNFPVEIKGLFTDDKVGDFSGVGFPWKVDLIYIHRLRPNFEIGSLVRRNN